MCVCNAVVSVCEFYTDAHECEYHHFYEGTVHKKDDSDTIYSSILMFFFFFKVHYTSLCFQVPPPKQQFKKIKNLREKFKT